MKHQDDFLSPDSATAGSGGTFLSAGMEAERMQAAHDEAVLNMKSGDKYPTFPEAFWDKQREAERFDVPGGSVFDFSKKG